jgi:hypothetical protein
MSIIKRKLYCRDKALDMSVPPHICTIKQLSLKTLTPAETASLSTTSYWIITATRYPFLFRLHLFYERVLKYGQYLCEIFV